MIYVVLHEDSHFGADVTVYADQDEALAAARDRAQQSADRPEDIEERELNRWHIQDRVLLSINYSPETGRVTVLARELQ